MRHLVVKKDVNLMLRNWWKKMIRIYKTSELDTIPTKMYPSDTAFDLTIIREHTRLTPTLALYSTGLVCEPDHDMALLIYARSSLLKYGYMLAEMDIMLIYVNYLR